MRILLSFCQSIKCVMYMFRIPDNIILKRNKIDFFSQPSSNQIYNLDITLHYASLCSICITFYFSESMNCQCVDKCEIKFHLQWNLIFALKYTYYERKKMSTSSSTLFGPKSAQSTHNPFNHI